MKHSRSEVSETLTPFSHVSLKESSQRPLCHFQQPHALPYLNQYSTHTHTQLLITLFHLPQTHPTSKMIYPQKFTTLLFIFFIISCPFCISETPPAAPPPLDDTEMKCGSCPCKSSCGGGSSGGGGQELPIPSPPPPSPPPPSLTYLSSQNCDQSPPPPPAPRFIYVTGGQPGNVPYQTQPYNWGNYNSAAPNTHVGFLVLACLVALVVCVASS